MSLRRAAAMGASAGLAGGAAMALASKLEQSFTHRPNSYIPGRTLSHLLRLSDPDSDRWLRNMAMHYGSAALAGSIRGVISAANLRGPFASFMHTNVRLTFDQTLENLTGVGAPPWTQPRDELFIDLAEKSVYGFVTGALTTWPSLPVARAQPAEDGSGCG